MRRMFIAALVWVAVLAYSPSLTHAQGMSAGDPDPQTRPAPKLSLQLEAATQQALGMPMELTLTVTNIGSANATYMSGPSAPANQFRATVEEIGKGTARIGFVEAGVGSARPIAIKPGETVVVPLAIRKGFGALLVEPGHMGSSFVPGFMDAMQPTPGKFRITVATATGSMRAASWPSAASNTIEIEMREDATLAARRSAELLAAIRKNDRYAIKVGLRIGAPPLILTLVKQLDSSADAQVTEAANLLQQVVNVPGSGDLPDEGARQLAALAERRPWTERDATQAGALLRLIPWGRANAYLEPLLKLTQRTDLAAVLPDVINALYLYDDPRVIPALQTLTHDADPAVGKSAQDAIQQLTRRGRIQAPPDIPPAGAVTASKLAQVIPLNFDGNHLDNALAFLRLTSGISYSADWPALAKVGITPETPVTLKMREVPVVESLRYLLRSLAPEGRLIYRIEGSGVVISTAQPGESLPPAAPADEQTVRKLQAPVSIHLDSNHLDNAIEFLRTTSGINIVVDWASLQSLSVARERAVTLQLSGAPVATVLDQLLAAAGGDKLAWVVEGNVVVIAARKPARLEPNAAP